MPRFSFSRLNNKHFLALAGNAVISILGVVQIGLQYRALSKTDVGIWFFFLTVYSFADALRNGFLGTATVKFYAGTDEARAQTVLGSVWYLATAITVGLALVDASCLFFLDHIHSPELTITIHWFGLTFLSSLVFTVIFWILVADENYAKILVLRLVNSGSMLLIIVALMFMHRMTIHALFLWNVITNCLTCTVGIFLGLSRIKTIASRSKECIWEIVHFGKYSLGTNMISNLLKSTDTFIITFILGPAALAIYNLPLRLMEIIEIPLRSFVGTGMSAMAAAFNNKNMQQVTFIFKKYSGMLTFAFIPLVIGAFILSDVAIAILGGSKYLGTEAANIFRIFMAFSILYPIDRFNGVTLDIIHQPRINFYKVIIMLVINVAGDFAGLMLFHNMYGVAAASFLTLLAGLLYGNYQLRRHIQYTYHSILSTGYFELKQLIQKNLLQKA